jgi:hypothetical protein
MSSTRWSFSFLREAQALPSHSLRLSFFWNLNKSALQIKTCKLSLSLIFDLKIQISDKAQTLASIHKNNHSEEERSSIERLLANPLCHRPLHAFDYGEATM